MQRDKIAESGLKNWAGHSLHKARGSRENGTQPSAPQLAEPPACFSFLKGSLLWVNEASSLLTKCSSYK